MLEDNAHKELVIWGTTGQAKVLHKFLVNDGFRVVAVFDNNTEQYHHSMEYRYFMARKASENGLMVIHPGHLAVSMLPLVVTTARTGVLIHSELLEAGLQPGIAIYLCRTQLSSAYLALNTL